MLKPIAIWYLRTLDRRLLHEGLRVGYEGCGKHSEEEVGSQDRCPCEARLDYLLNRVEESLHRFERARDQYGFWKWLSWYMKSRRKTFHGFDWMTMTVPSIASVFSQRISAEISPG